MLGAAYWPVLVVSTDVPTTVSPTPASATMSAPDPALNGLQAISVLAATMTAPDPADFSVGLIPTPAIATMSAPSPDLTGSISEISPAPASATMTAPDPSVARPIFLTVTPASMTAETADPVLSYGFVVSQADPDFSGVPRESTNPREHARQIAGVLNRLMQGKMNATAKITLNANTTKTYWRDGRLSPSSSVSFDPMTANAAAEKAAGTLFVSETDRKAGQWLITHANAASTDRTFMAKIIA